MRRGAGYHRVCKHKEGFPGVVRGSRIKSGCGQRLTKELVATKKTVDARGLSCPEPVLKLKQVIDAENEILLLVDNRASVENCGRFARSKGFDVSVTGGKGRYELLLMKALAAV